MPFKIVRNDITRVAADAIVNTANPEPCFGSGTDAAVYKAAGAEELLAARKKIGRIAPGECAVTPAFALPAKYVIHTVGPAWTDGAHGEFDVLSSCYRKPLLLAEQLGCESIAFPLIAAGVYGFPKDKALGTALDVIREYLKDSEMDVTLVVFNPGAFTIAQSLSERVEAYIDENYVRAKAAEEYGGADEEYVSGMAARRREEARRRRQYDAAAGAPKAGGGVPNAGASAQAAGNAYAEMAATSVAMTQKPLMPYVQEPPAANASSAKASYAAPASPKAKKPSLDEVVKNLGESFQARLLRFIDERGLKDSDVYHGANISKQIFSNIRCSEGYIPTKRNVLALAVGLKLNLDDAKDLLAAAGYALTNNSMTDLIVSFCLTNGIWDIFEVNRLLFKYTGAYLGSTME